MARTEHRLEQRQRMLAAKLTQRVQMMRDVLAPPGKRPPFHEQLSNAESLRWWRTHRYDALGAQVLQYLQPAAIEELDVALSRQIEADQNAEMGTP